MRTVTSLFVCLILSFAGSRAFAEAIDDDTRCGSVEALFGASADRDKLRDVLDYVLQTMRSVDHAHGLKGSPEILPQMTEEGRSAVALIVVRRCRDRAGVTLADTTIETYEAIRAMGSRLGFSKTPARWAQGHPRRETSVPSVRARPSPSGLAALGILNSFR
jgi:hypothetical protein